MQVIKTFYNDVTKSNSILNSLLSKVQTIGYINISIPKIQQTCQVSHR